MPPDSRRPLDTFYDENMGRLMTYNMEVTEKRILCNLYYIPHKSIKWISLHIPSLNELISIFLSFDLICAHTFQVQVFVDGVCTMLLV